MAAITQKDTTFTKIFVGGLPYHTTDKSLREFFDAFGDIEEAVVITDRQTGKSRGYGFVTMANREAAERACKDPNPIIDGRKANVNLAYLGAKPRGIQTAFPIALKTGIPGVLPSQFGIPTQYVYQPYMTATAPSLMATTVQHSPLSPTTAGQYLDYTAAYGSQLAAAATGFEAFPYATSTAGLVATASPYTYAVPQQIAAGGHAFYQTPQLQERMQ